jgi:hypothetical protein
VAGNKDLIIVRAGDDSLHPGWLAGPGHSRFDLFVSYYGNTPDRYRDRATFYHVAPGPRWPAHHEICERHGDIVGRYEYVAFACDDLQAGPAVWARLFATCRQYRLDLAQPAVEGYVSHPITRPRADCRLRYTNFVEIMCPVFHGAALHRVQWTLAESISGWGLDFLWPGLLPHPAHRLAVLDAVRVRHARPPLAGPLQGALRARGIDPREEFARVVAKHGVTDFTPREYGRVSRRRFPWSLFGGRNCRSVADDRGGHFVTVTNTGSPL